MTLIIMLILASISLSGVIGGKGLFKRTEKASNRYNEAKARETLETVLLTDGQYDKNINPEYNQNKYLNELIKKEIPGSNVIEDVAIIGGEYAYELDRSVPKIGHYLGNPKDLIWPKVTTTEPVLADDYRSASFTITATIDEKAIKGITRIEVWLLGEIIKEYKYTDNTKDTRTETFETNRNGEYTIKAYADLKGSTQTTVEGIVPTVEFLPNGSTEWKKEHSTKITVRDTSEKVKSLKYKWTNSTKTPAETEFIESCNNNDTITGKDITGIYYLWVLFETESGSKAMDVSNGFYFDNEFPKATCRVRWILGKTSNTCRLQIWNASDRHSGIDTNVVKAYITPENGTRGEYDLLMNGNSGEARVENLDVETITKAEIEVKDNAGNILTFKKNTGKIYLIKEGNLVSGIKPVKTGGATYSTKKGTGVLMDMGNVWSNMSIGFNIIPSLISGLGWSISEKYLDRGLQADQLEVACAMDKPIESSWKDGEWIYDQSTAAYKILGAWQEDLTPGDYVMQVGKNNEYKWVGFGMICNKNGTTSSNWRTFCVPDLWYVGSWDC